MRVLNALIGDIFEYSGVWSDMLWRKVRENLAIFFVTERSLFLSVMGLTTICVLAFEPLLFGFEFKGHLGWVPSHVSAQILRANSDQGFVGYTLKFFNAGEYSYYYFDRYPIPFAMSMNAILSFFKGDLRNWIYASRIIMDLIFILTIYYAYLISKEFTSDLWKRWSIVLLTFSGQYFMTYKAMIHFDQPAILGMTALLNAILVFERSGDKKGLIFWSFVAPLMGRGYASLFVLALYLLMKALSGKFGESLRLALKTLIPSGTICTLMLSYNILVEAKVRNVPVAQVSIVQSAFSRLGIEKFTESHQEEKVQWSVFLDDQLSRQKLQLTPFFVGKKQSTYFCFILLGSIFFFYRRNWKTIFSFTTGLLLLSGVVWIFPMKRLAAFHDYTTMYYVGVPLVIYGLLIPRLRPARFVFTVSMVLFLLSLWRISNKQSENLVTINSLADEFHVVREIIGKQTISGNEPILYPYQGRAEIFTGRPYILGFYFHDMALALNESESDYVLSNNPLEGRDPLFAGKYMNLYVTKK